MKNPFLIGMMIGTTLTIPFLDYWQSFAIPFGIEVIAYFLINDRRN